MIPTRLRRGLLVVPVILALGATPARAETPPPAVRHEDPAEVPRTEGDSFTISYTDTPYLSLRWMPFELITGIGLVGAEFKIRPDITVVTQLGVGRVKVSTPSGDGTTEISKRKTYLSAELQGRYYIVGALGAGIYGSVDVNNTWLDTDLLVNSPLLNVAAGLRSGISFGGSYTSGIGLGADMRFLVHRRLYRPTPSEPSPPDSDRPSTMAFGAEVAVTYVF